MIVIVDDNTERGLALRHSALSDYLPCAFCGVSEFVHFPHGKDIVVLCADREDQLSAETMPIRRRTVDCILILREKLCSAAENLRLHGSSGG